MPTSEGHSYSSSPVRGAVIGQDVPWQLLLCDHLLFRRWRLSIIILIAGLIEDETCVLLERSAVGVDIYTSLYGK